MSGRPDVAAFSDGDKDDLVTAAAAVLEAAKPEGKNRAGEAESQTPNVAAGE